MIHQCTYSQMVIIPLSIVCLICLALYAQQRKSFTDVPLGGHQSGITLHKRQLHNLLMLDFVPRRSSRFVDCDKLFVGTPLDQYNMSSLYWSLYHKFQAEVVKGVLTEGHSGTQITQMKAMHYLAARPSIRHICETGFNMGHSSFNFLTSNPKAIVHSFDIGTHGYAKVMSEFITEQFPGRFFIHFGDSRETVPQFIRANPTFRCDLIYVDGGHTYDIATADLENFVSIWNISNLDNAIIFDDYPTLVSTLNLGLAWQNMIRRHSVTELMRCMHSKQQYRRGFVIGTMINKGFLNGAERSVLAQDSTFRDSEAKLEDAKSMPAGSGRPT